VCDGPEAPTPEEKTQMKKQNSALLDNIEKKGKHSYYYAHKPKEFSMENAKLIEGVGKTYGGTPVLLKTVSNEE